MNKTLNLKKIVLRDKRAFVFINPQMLDSTDLTTYVIPSVTKEGKHILGYRWIDVFTGDICTNDYKHPYVLTWVTRALNYDYKVAVSFNWLKEHFNLDVTQDQFYAELSAKSQHVGHVIKMLTEKHDETFYGFRIPADKTNEVVEIGEASYKCNCYEDNGMGDWIVFPEVDGAPDISNPMLVPGIDFDNFYTVIPYTTYTVNSKTGKIMNTDTQFFDYIT